MNKASRILTTTYNYYKFNTGLKLHVLCCVHNHNIKCLIIKTKIANILPRSFVSNNDFTNQEEIYSAPLTGRIKNLKRLTLVSSAAGIVIQYLFWVKMAHESGMAMFQLIGTSILLGFFNFIIPVIINFLTRKYVTKVYYDSKKDNYTLLVYTIFVKSKPITFTPGDVKETNFGMFTTAIIKNRAFFLDPMYFTDVEHYKRIMGYDKPIDFSLPTKKSDNEKESS